MGSKIKNVTVNLEFPFDHDGREVKSLTFRRMRAGDSLIAENETNQAKAGFMMFAELAGVDIEVIKKIDLEDFNKISTEVEPLMGKSPSKSETEQTATEATTEALPPFDGATT